MRSWVLICVLGSAAAFGCEAAPAQQVDASPLPNIGCFSGYYVTEAVTGQAAPFTPPAFAIDGDGSGGANGFTCTDTQEATACSSATNSPILFSHLTNQGGLITNSVATTEPHACANDPTKGSCVTRSQSITLSHPAWIGDQGAQIESCTNDFPEPSCTTPLPDQCDAVDPNLIGCMVTIIAGQYTL